MENLTTDYTEGNTNYREKTTENTEGIADDTHEYLNHMDLQMHGMEKKNMARENTIE